MGFLNKIFGKKKQDENAQPIILDEIDPSFFDPEDGEQQHASLGKETDDATEPETGNRDPKESPAESEVICRLREELQIERDLRNEETAQNRNLYKQLQEARDTLQNERKDHKKECDRLRSSIKRLAKIAFGKKNEGLKNFIDEIPPELKKVLEDVGISLDLTKEEDLSQSGKGKADQQEESGDGGSKANGQNTQGGSAGVNAADGKNVGGTPGTGGSGSFSGSGAASGDGKGANAGENPGAGGSGGIPGNGPASGDDKDESGRGNAPGNGKDVSDLAAGNGSRKKGNPNIRKKPGYLDSYSSNLAWGFNGMNLTLDDFRDLYIPEDSWEDYQSALQKAREAYEQGKPIDEVNRTFLAYLSSDYHVVTTVEYVPGFYYTKKTLTPIAKGCQTTMQAHRINRMFKASAFSPSVGAHVAFNKYRNGLPF